MIFNSSRPSVTTRKEEEVRDQRCEKNNRSARAKAIATSNVARVVAAAFAAVHNRPVFSPTSRDAREWVFERLKSESRDA